MLFTAAIGYGIIPERQYVLHVSLLFVVLQL